MNKVKIRFKQLIALLWWLFIPTLILVEFVKYSSPKIWHILKVSWYRAQGDFEYWVGILKDIKGINGK